MLDVPEKLYNRFLNICGIDEAGRGPLAGPVCAAAVILPRGIQIDGLNDSKKLSAKKREYLYNIIIEKAVCFSVAYASEKEIDNFNILNATYLAMNRALEGLAPKADFAMIDGNRSDGINTDNMTVIGGDGIYSCIAAASVLAKVSRDRYMLQMAEKYPQYAFERHKGYGTKLHYEKIRQYGLCEIHRRTFLKKLH